MLDYFRDPIWQFVGILVAILVSFIIFLAQRSKKRLTYEMKSVSPILSKAAERAGKLQIFYDSIPVKNVSLVEFILRNTGNIPITAADYERSIVFFFGDQSKVLSVQVTERSPQNLLVEPSNDEHSIVLHPLLLNGGDSITFTAVISEYNHMIVDGRIVGVKNITQQGVDNWGSLLSTAIGYLIGVPIIIYSLIGKPITPSPILSILALMGFIMFLVGTLSSRSYKRLSKVMIKEFKHEMNHIQNSKVIN